MENFLRDVTSGKVVAVGPPGAEQKMVNLAEEQPYINKVLVANGFENLKLTGRTPIQAFMHSLDIRNAGEAANYNANIVKSMYQASKAYVPEDFALRMASVVSNNTKGYDAFIKDVISNKDHAGDFLSKMTGVSKITDAQKKEWSGEGGLGIFTAYLHRDASTTDRLRSTGFFIDNAISKMSEYYKDQKKYEEEGMKIDLGGDNIRTVKTPDDYRNVLAELTLLQAKNNMNGSPSPDGRGMTPVSGSPMCNYWNNTWMAGM
jgi:hypothetical protein